MSLDELARTASAALTEATTSRIDTSLGQMALRRTVRRRRRTHITVVAVVVVALVGTVGTKIDRRTALPNLATPIPTPTAVVPTPTPVHPSPTPVIPHPAAIIVRGAQGLLAVNPVTGTPLKLIRRDSSPYLYSGDILGTSGDGTQVAYEGQAGPVPSVVIADLWRTPPRAPYSVDVSRGWQATARWSADGITVARFSAPADLLTTTIQGGRVANEKAQPTAWVGDISSNVLPSWSPDGRRLAFSAMDRRSARNLYLINADGSNLRELDPGTRLGGVAEVAWSPDGSRIAYVEANSLVVINPDGTGRRVVGPVGDSVEDKYVGTGIAWSPDSTSVAFLGRNLEKSGWALYVMDLNGSRRLVPVPGVVGFTLAWAAGS